jgi:hypothetical protein
MLVQGAKIHKTWRVWKKDWLLHSHLLGSPRVTGEGHGGPGQRRSPSDDLPAAGALKLRNKGPSLINPTTTKPNTNTYSYLNTPLTHHSRGGGTGNPVWNLTEELIIKEEEGAFQLPPPTPKV